MKFGIGDTHIGGIDAFGNRVSGDPILTPWGRRMAATKQKGVKPWAKEEYDFVERERCRIPPTKFKDIAKVLGRTEGSVEGAAKRIGLTKLGRQWNCHRKFTKEEEEDIKRIITYCIEMRGWVGTEIRQCLKNFGYVMCPSSVHKRIHQLPISILSQYQRNVMIKRCNISARRCNEEYRHKKRGPHGRFSPNESSYSY